LTYRAIFHPQFNVDADEAKDWYEDQLPGLGDRFESALDDCVTVLIERPESFQEMRGALRYARLRNFPYGIVFKIDGSLLLLGGVFHTARNRTRWDARF
jgi:hypothetical protein